MVRPWTLPAGCGVLQVRSSRSLPSTALISGARFAGSPNLGYSCVPVTVELTTVTARARQDRRSAGCSNTPTKLRTAWSPFRLVSCRRREQRSHHSPERNRHAHHDWQNRARKDWRLVRPSPAVGRAHSRGRGTSCAAKYGELVLCVRKRGAHHLSLATGNRNSAGDYLCSLGGRSMEQLTGPESSGDAWMVHPRDAWMGLQLHGGHRPYSYGSGISVRSPQISPRTDLDCWSVSVVDDSWHGVHWSNHAL